jgi:hypothetical protein
MDARTVLAVFSQLGPSGFDLFGKLKTALIGTTFDTEQKPFDIVMEVLNAIP